MKTRINILLLLAAFSFSVHGTEISKSEWMNAVSNALPNAFCGSTQYYRQCYKVSDQECVDAAASAAKSCLAKTNIPDMLVQPMADAKWGTIIAVCVTRIYEHSLEQKRIHNKKCDDPNYWQ